MYLRNLMKYFQLNIFALIKKMHILIISICNNLEKLIKYFKDLLQMHVSLQSHQFLMAYRYDLQLNQMLA